MERPKAAARAIYDRLSRRYDLLAGTAERKPREAALDLLAPVAGETILEIGCGTGYALSRLARAVGDTGMVHGLDLSRGMLEVARRRLVDAGLADRVSLRVGDGATLPYPDSAYDAVFMSFTLELFDTPEIPLVLAECRRVLRPGGRLAVVALSRKCKGSLSRAMVGLYEWFHERLPGYVDCRPIYIDDALTASGFEVKDRRPMGMWGLPVEAVVGFVHG